MKQTLILASNSPRRKSLLANEGYKFDVYPSNIDENLDINNPYELVSTLSKNKAESVYKKFPDSIIIAADTMVFMEDKLFGKPSTFNDAFTMLKEFSGKSHGIVTGITILSKDFMITETDEALINLKDLKKNQITKFLKESNPYDKAGGYSVEELPKDFIKKINGNITTVLGLPMNIVKKHLSSLT